jgi:hypothetical protein
MDDDERRLLRERIQAAGTDVVELIIRNQLNDALEKLALEKHKVAQLRSEILDTAIRRRHTLSCALSVPRAHVPNFLF